MVGMPTLVTARTPAPEHTGFRRLWRVTKQLFHEMTGAVFAILALAWLNAALRAWTRDVAHWLIGVTLTVAAMFVFFSFASFRRARRI